MNTLSINNLCVSHSTPDNEAEFYYLIDNVYYHGVGLGKVNPMFY
jgi:hypothetical protein